MQHRRRRFWLSFWNRQIWPPPTHETRILCGGGIVADAGGYGTKMWQKRRSAQMQRWRGKRAKEKNGGAGAASRAPRCVSKRTVGARRCRRRRRRRRMRWPIGRLDRSRPRLRLALSRRWPLLALVRACAFASFPLGSCARFFARLLAPPTAHATFAFLLVYSRRASSVSDKMLC